MQKLAEDSFPMLCEKWAAEFIVVRESTEDDPRLDRPKTSTIHWCRPSYGLGLQTSKSIGICTGSVHTVLTEILGMSKMFAWWDPRMRTPDNSDLLPAWPWECPPQFSNSRWHLGPPLPVWIKVNSGNTQADSVMGLVFWDSEIMLDYLEKVKNYWGAVLCNLS